MNDANQDEDREVEEPQEPVDPPQENNSHKRKPAWARESIQGAERYGSPEEYQEIEETKELVDPPHEKNSYKRKPT